MKDTAQAVLRKLDLDYVITSILSDADQNREIVMWDRPRNSYFSVRVPWKTRFSQEHTADCIVQQLTDRLAEWRTVRVRRQRKEDPIGTAPVMKSSSVGVD